MYALLLVWAFAVFVTGGYCQNENGGLIIFGPKKIHPKSVFKVVITNTLNQQVRLQATLENLDDPSILRQVQIHGVGQQSSKSITFNVADIEKCDCYQLEVKSLDNTFSFIEHASLEYDAKTAITLIETDKPAYTPGEKLRFRVLVVDINTKPMTRIETVDVAIIDPDNKVFRKWPFARLHKGVFESDVQLSSLSTFGNWSVTVVVDGVEELKYFVVKEYNLPKFFVRASPLKPVLLDDTKISIMLETAYTYNLPVEGSYKAKLFLNEPIGQPNRIAEGRINGKTTVHFHLMDQVNMDIHSDSTQVTLMVEVQETTSNHTVNITELLPIYRHPYNMSITSKKPLKPGLPYVISLSVKDHLGRPAGANKPNYASITADFYDNHEKHYTVKLNNNGEGTLELLVPSNAEFLRITGEYDESSYESLHINDIIMEKTEANAYLSVDFNRSYKGQLHRNGDVYFTVTSSEKMTYIAYIVVTRGNIIKCSYEAVHNLTNYNLKVKMTPEMSSESRLIVYYIKNYYVVYDDIELKFDKFNNYFAVTLDKESYAPGETISMKVSAAKDSYVALSVIGQIVMLVENKRNNFDMNDVLHELAEYTYGGFEHSFEIHSFGLFLRSTASTAASPRSGMSRFGGLSLNSKGTSRNEHFPMETYLWENFTMNGRDSEKTIKVIAPDSSTKYFVSGFALSPTMGLGLIKQPLQLIVKTDFYLDVSLPYSVKRGEKLVVRAIVFNFHQHKLTTQVTLFNKNDQLEFEETSSNDLPYRSKVVTAQPNTGTSVSFMVRAKIIGLVTIKLKAECQLADNTIKHMLRVTPESHFYDHYESRYINLPTFNKTSYEFILNVPQEIDAGSLKILLKVYTYPLEEAIKNLGDLIQVPSVCGEENIVRLAHNIVIYDYLKETETEEKPINWQAKAYLTEGLQSQLKCRRKDGSFSGSKNSEKGCTFLTAFVVKSLRIAAKYVDVQKAIVNDAFDWLIKKQLPDGQFLEVGTIIHPEMQGLISSNSSRFALTAYVLVALVENQEVREKYRMNVDLTADYLRNNFDIIENEYDLSLVTYAFFLINDHQKDNFLNKLLETSLYYRYTKERYWSEEPVQMEIVGYAVLTYLLDERVPDATPIVRWLKMQRYDNGGFARTQDTFVGLKALAAFARLTSAKMNDYRIIVSSENKYKNYVVMRTFNVNHSQLPQITTLDYFRKLYVAVEGIGYGLIHLAYQYYQNVMISNQYAKYAFTLDVQELTTTVNDALHLKICAGYNEKPDRERSDMTRVDVFLPSGFILEKDAVEDITKQIQRVEQRFGNTSLAVYYNYLTSVQCCFKVTAKRRFTFAMKMPLYVKVFNYYDHDEFAFKQYEPTL